MTIAINTGNINNSESPSALSSPFEITVAYAGAVTAGSTLLLALTHEGGFSVSSVSDSVNGSWGAARIAVDDV